MNCSRKNKHRCVTKGMGLKILIVLLLIGVAFWCGGLYAIARADTTVEEIPSKYGIIQNDVVQVKMAEPWESGKYNFVALDVPMDEQLQEYTYFLAEGYNVDFAFIMAVIDTESKFQSDIVSATDDYGLMQINKCNHSWLTKQLNITDFTDPYQNVKAGLFVLSNLFQKYNDPSMVLMAYNLGEGGAAELWNKGIYSNSYSSSVMQKAEFYSDYIKERMSTEND